MLSESELKAYTQDIPRDLQHLKGEPPVAGAAHGSAPTDTQRMDWLERNLMHITHDRASCSVDMSGRCVRGQLVNEARGANGGPSYFRVNHRSIREAIDAAMKWPINS